MTSGNTVWQRRIRRGRAAVLTLALALAGLLAMPSSASAVIGGERSTYGPWAVRMLVDGQPHCTGTAVSDRWILSASHCFFDLPDQPVADRRITFLVGSKDVRRATRLRPIAGSRVANPGGADMMMIKVPVMKHVTPAKLSVKKVRTGQTLRILGWGATCTDREELDCQSKVLRQATAKVLDVRRNRERCIGFAGTDGINICGTRVSGEPAGGDSGGPVMTIAPKGQERLAGVFFGSDRDSMVGAGVVLPQLTWIRATVRK
ncbi:S1 family peptidase [Kineosporia succinea]|uniref:Secreted trypsin-like serine protease n=1 Tax=Kineosporia succinea TaxID=84632 RepID=A0ABT9PA26_9ACTN|nr:trypsin-like serine protease [Kineosporia succinea]MDP9829259.1 secreted trypsin-like serine protease [Kineosporia succinea]